MLKALKSLVLVSAIILSGNLSVSAQTEITSSKTECNKYSFGITSIMPVTILTDSNSFIINKWEMSEYKENGKVQELPNYEIEFFEDGTYSAVEEDDFDEGMWNIDEGNTKFIFDDSSPYREEWNILSMDAKKIIFKFTDGGKTYEYTFVPWVKRVQE